MSNSNISFLDRILDCYTFFMYYIGPLLLALILIFFGIVMIRKYQELVRLYDEEKTTDKEIRQTVHKKILAILSFIFSVPYLVYAIMFFCGYEFYPNILEGDISSFAVFVFYSIPLFYALITTLFSVHLFKIYKKDKKTLFLILFLLFSIITLICDIVALIVLFLFTMGIIFAIF